MFDGTYLGGDLVDHFHGIWELLLVPSEISFAIGVFDVQPNHIHGDVEFVKVGVDRQNVVLVVVIPPALMIRDGEGRGQRGRAWRKMVGL